MKFAPVLRISTIVLAGLLFTACTHVEPAETSSESAFAGNQVIYEDFQTTTKPATSPAQSCEGVLEEITRSFDGLLKCPSLQQVVDHVDPGGQLSDDELISEMTFWKFNHCAVTAATGKDLERPLIRESETQPSAPSLYEKPIETVAPPNKIKDESLVRQIEFVPCAIPDGIVPIKK